MTDRRVARLVDLAGLVRDARMARLMAATTRRDATLALREGLIAPACDDPAALQAQVAYGQWVERREAALTRQSERDEAEVAEAKRLAALAFARARVVERLKDQLS